MTNESSRRQFLKSMGLGISALPFVGNLPSLGFENSQSKKQRLVVVFSPNGVVPKNFWPQQTGSEFELPPILQPLAPFQDQMLVCKGISEKVRGDGDSHMRGIGCLLTGIELFPGNIQGGSHTPAGWASGHSIDQEIKRYLQASPETKTRFGSLEFGVLVPERADTWTRMVYDGPNRPVAPIDDPYQMFKKLYGQNKDRETLISVLDSLSDEFATLKSKVSSEDRHLLEDHAELVRKMEKDLHAAQEDQNVGHAVPDLEPGVRDENGNMPQLTKMQIDLMVNSFLADMSRIATFQITNSVGNAKMTWLDINKGHHGISHEPDSNEEAVAQLTKINTWYCEQVAYLAKRLSEIPEPGTDGSMLDHTTIIWTNELGAGNSHTLDNIPFVMVGGGLGFQMGRSLRFKNMPHNRLLISLAHAYGHNIEAFGNTDLSKGGVVSELFG